MPAKSTARSAIRRRMMSIIYGCGWAAPCGALPIAVVLTILAAEGQSEFVIRPARPQRRGVCAVYCVTVTVGITLPARSDCTPLASAGRLQKMNWVEPRPSSE